MILSGMRCNMKKNNYQKGTTLIELLLYLAIASGIMLSLVTFAWDVIGGGAKSARQEDVSSSVRYLSSRIGYEIRNANSINSVSSSSISLADSVPANNPTVFSLSGNNLTIKEGSAAAVNLNPNSVKVTSLAFSNYSSSGNETQHIMYTLTVQSSYPSKGNIFETDSMESSVEVRSH